MITFELFLRLLYQTPQPRSGFPLQQRQLVHHLLAQLRVVPVASRACAPHMDRKTKEHRSRPRPLLDAHLLDLATFP